MKTSTVDAAEIERFSKLAATWWDPGGPMAPLHKINPLRVEWIIKKIVEHYGLQAPGSRLQKEITSPKPEARSPEPISILDIGCGAGLVCEPLAIAGATVTGIDAAAKNIEAARIHAEQSELNIDYRCTTAEDLLQTGAQFDVVLALEIIEHVADIPTFVEATTKLVKPGGLLIFSTLNRTAKAYALAIVGAEYVLRWLPRGTHDWNKFVKPSELTRELRKHAVEVQEMTGLIMNPLTWQWSLNPKDVDVNYLLAAKKLSSRATCPPKL